MTKIDTKAFEALTRARSNLIIDQPFFGALALRLKLVEDSTIPTAAVDSKTFWYSPKFINGLTPSQVKTLVGHEVGHCVFGHPARCYGRNPQKWNMAADYVVNEMLEGAKFEALPNWLLNPAFYGMSADQIYNLIPDGEGGPSDQPGTGKPGGGMCDVRSGQDANAPRDQAASESDARDWAVAAVQAAQAAKMRGKLPANLERFVDGLFEAKVDWKEVLRRFVSAKSNGDFTFSRPNRRFLPYDMHLPTMYSESMGEMFVGVDTSGSIDDETLKVFGSEINAIMGEARPERVHVIYCDAEVNHVDVFERDEPIVVKPHGGGGTDLTKIFDYVTEHGIEPVCGVVLTDGYTPFGHAPAYPSLWVMTTEVVAPYGESLHIEV